jgi:hypothetical protein
VQSNYTLSLWGGVNVKEFFKDIITNYLDDNVILPLLEALALNDSYVINYKRSFLFL